MYNPLPKSLTIEKSKIHGLGLFAVEKISRGVTLGMTHIKNDAYENGHIRTPLGGFYNHSNNPNCETYYVDEVLYLRTLKDISHGEEITVKYRLYSILPP
jgi:SET domain-containing protein